MHAIPSIRTTHTNNIPALKTLYAKAFPDENLFPLVQKLLKLTPPVISLTAGYNNTPIGHIIFTLCHIKSSASQRALLGPLCVLPNQQKKGIGSMLIHNGFNHLKTSNINHCYVLGDPAFYHRFGFKQEHKIQPPYTLPNAWQTAWQSVCLNTSGTQPNETLIVPEPWRQKTLWLPKLQPPISQSNMASNTTHNTNTTGWNFDNSYTQLPEHFYTRLKPIAVNNPQLVIVNHALAKDLGLTFNHHSKHKLAQLFTGNTLPGGAEPIAQAYAGHQFGHFTMLGDGRAHLIGEHITPKNKRVDIQFKGSGKTPYGRRGDGRAALGPMLREYIISEAMHHLGIATTRSLAVTTTGEPVYRDTELQGAILTRIAASHIRIGTFEYAAAQKNIKHLKQLADYTINRHYPKLKTSHKPYLDFIKAVMEQQITLVVEWLRVGFIHGVMNTDNMAISGETIDYGPCAFMDAYDPQTVFSSIDRMGRYAYANQPHITQWNLARFAETLLPLLHDNIEQAATLAEEVIQSFNATFQKTWLAMMRKKLGLDGTKKDDEPLIGTLLKWMQQHQCDYTNTFRDLISETLPKGEHYHTKEFQQWWQRWQNRLKQNRKNIKTSLNVMRANNPVIIPRNHNVEKALLAAETASDFSTLHTLLKALKSPYKHNAQHTAFYTPPKPGARIYQTFCGT